MLGEKIGDETGKVTTRRVLPGDDYRYVKMEISFEGQGTVFGIQAMNMGTYTVFERIPGQMYGEGRGILMTMDGDGAIWSGNGVGHMGENGQMVFAFAISVQTDSQKLARLNNVMIMGENRTEMEGGYTTTTYEWKA